MQNMTMPQTQPEGMALNDVNWWIETSQNLLATWGPRILALVATLVIGWLVVKIVTAIVRRLMTKAKVEPTLVGFTAHMIYMGLMALVIISALSAAGFPTTSFVAIIGAAGLAVGFALQGSLASFAAGIMLIVFRPFKVGDYIEAAGTGGVVEEIQVFATRLKTPDNKAVLVPNAAVTAGNIVNFSAKDIRRVDLVFGIGYGDDIKKAKQLLMTILTRDKRVLKDPAPTVAVLELGDNSVNFAVRPWVATADYWNVLFDVTEAVKLEFDANGLSIPFPQHDVHVHQAA